MALHAVARRALAAGAAAGLFALAGAGAASADTTPPPPPPLTLQEAFTGGGTGSSADAASAAATANAMAQQAAFEKASGGMCTDSGTKVNSFMAGGQFAALATISATCTVPVPSGSGS